MKINVIRHNYRRGPSKEYHYGKQTKAWQKCIVDLQVKCNLWVNCEPKFDLYVIQIKTDLHFIYLNLIFFPQIGYQNLRKYPETNKNITLHIIKGNNNGTALIQWQYLKINLDLYFIYRNVIIKLSESGYKKLIHKYNFGR